MPKNTVPWPLDDDSHQHPLLRRWDQRAAVNAQGVLAVTEGAPIALEDGIQVTFEPGGLYATGDYWLIPARVAGNGLLDWPATGGAPAALPPRGRHHYAALGVAGDGNFDECCCRFGTLCELIQAGSSRQPGVNDRRAVFASPAATAKAGAKPAPKRTRAKAKTIAKPG